MYIQILAQVHSEKTYHYGQPKDCIGINIRESDDEHTICFGKDP